jgi:uncharacterized membrane protein
VPEATLVFPLMSGLVALLGAPLWVGMVPPNRFYGLRTAVTLADEALWYAANRATGRDIVMVGGLALVVSLELADAVGAAAYDIIMTLVLAGGLALIAFLGFARARHI